MTYATKGLRNVFNCRCCDVLFSPSIDSPNAPIHLNACGHLMCLGCVMKNRREEPKRYPESRPFSVDCVTCSSTSNDLHQPTRAKYLIDILSEIDSQCKSKYFSSAVVDAAQLTSLTCPGCTTRYWWHPDVRSAYILVCGHVLCMACVEMKKREKSEEETARHGCGLSNVVDCSTCGLGTMFNSTEEQRDPIGGGFYCFSAAINLIPKANKCSDGMTIAIELKEKGEKYDAIMGPFLPTVRTNIQSLENFIGEFRKRFPEVNGESVQEEEKEDGERAAKRPRLDESAEEGEKQRNEEDTEI